MFEFIAGLVLVVVYYAVLIGLFVLVAYLAKEFLSDISFKSDYVILAVLWFIMIFLAFWMVAPIVDALNQERVGVGVVLECNETEESSVVYVLVGEGIFPIFNVKTVYLIKVKLNETIIQLKSSESYPVGSKVEVWKSPFLGYYLKDA